MLKLSEPHRLVVTLHDVQGCRTKKLRRLWTVISARCGRGFFYARQQLQAYLSDYLK